MTNKGYVIMELKPETRKKINILKAHRGDPSYDVTIRFLYDRYMGDL